MLSLMAPRGHTSVGRGLEPSAEHALDHDTRRRVLWGVGLILAGALAPGLASVLACAPSGAMPGGPAEAAAPTAVELPEGPPPPTGGLPMPALDVDWRPPSLVAGDVRALAKAVSAHPRIGLLVDPAVGEREPSQRPSESSLDAVALATLLGQLAPNTAVHPLGSESLEAVVLEDPPLVPEIGGEGRVQWQLPDTLAIDRERIAAWVERGDPAIMVIGPVGIDGLTWRTLGEVSVGSCEPLTDALLDGQQSSLALLEPFLDHADAVLMAIYQAELAAVVPTLAEELAEFAPHKTRDEFSSPDAWARYECGSRYRDYLEPFAGCVETPGAGSCSMAPRMFLRESARIGSIEPSVYVPQHCPARLGRDYVEELRTPGRRAAELAGDLLDPRWLALAERLATLGEIHGALEEICRPARRRWSEQDLESLAQRMIAVGELFQRDEVPPHDARFLANDLTFHVPGVGAVQQLARFDGGTGSASRAITNEARELRRFAKERARCVARPGEPPLMVLLIDGATAKPEFLGFYNAEELRCGELGPLD